MTLEQDKFISKLKQQLDQSAENVSPEVGRRLQQARQQALRIPRKRWFFAGLLSRILAPNRKRRYRIAWAGSLAAVFVAAAIYIALVPGLNDHLEVDALEVLAAEDSLEFYDELAFYEWLAKENAQDAG